MTPVLMWKSLRWCVDQSSGYFQGVRKMVVAENLLYVLDTEVSSEQWYQSMAVVLKQQEVDFGHLVKLKVKLKLRECREIRKFFFILSLISIFIFIFCFYKQFKFQSVLEHFDLPPCWLVAGDRLFLIKENESYFKQII